MSLVLGALVHGLAVGVRGADADWSLTWGLVGGMALMLGLGLLQGVGFGLSLLNTPAAMVIYFAYLFALPTILGIGSALMDWFKSFAEWINFNQAQSVLYDGFWNMSGSEWGKLIVSGILWLGLPLAFGIRRILRAEVK